MDVWSSFVLNCCNNHSIFLLRDRDGTDNILHNQEGVTQGDSLAMVAYGIGVLTPIKLLKWTYHDVTKPWYADDAGELCTSDNLERYFNLLKRHGPDQGYYQYH